MPSVDSILQAELKAILDLLNQQLQQLSDQLMAQQYWPVYVQGVDFTHAKTNLCTHIRQLEYDNDAMKPGETVSYQGICGTTAESLALIQATNETRGQLSMLLRKMDKIIVQSEQGRLRLSVHALNALGYTLASKTFRFDEARGYLKKALAFRPNDSAILDSMGWLNYRSGRYEEALVLLKKAYSKQPEAEIATHLGETLWVLGRQQEAKQIWQEAAEKFPEDNTLIEALKRIQ